MLAINTLTLCGSSPVGEYEVSLALDHELAMLMLAQG